MNDAVGGQRFKDIAEAASDWFWETDENLRLSYISDRFIDFTGVKPEDVLGKTHWELAGSDPEQDAKWRRHREDLEAHRPFRDFHYSTWDRNGQTRHWKISGKPVFDEAGVFKGYRGAATDETAEVDARERVEKAEAALAEKSALLETTLEGMCHGIAVHDADLKLVAFNQNYLELLDFPPGFVRLGLSFEEIIRFLAERGDYGPGDAERQVKERLDSVRRKKRHRSELMRPNGSTFAVRRNPLPQGGFVTTFTDITERKRAEEAVRESGERVRAIMDNVADGLITIDEEGAIESFNRSAERMFGYSAREVIGKNVTLLMPEPERGAHDGYLARYVRTGKGKIIGKGPREVLGRRKDGSTLPLELAVAEMSFGEKRLFIGALRDNTERKRAEEQVAQAHSRLIDAVESIPASFILYDPDERLILCNKRAHEFFPSDILVPGTHFDDLTRARAKMVMPDAAGQRLEEWVHERLKRFRGPGAPIEEHQANGRWTQAFERKTSEGGTVCIRTDITERKRAEKELEQLNTQLCANADELKRSNAELERFAYIASHDLQEPLRMVAGYCQLLQRRYKGKLDADADDFISFAVDGATRMRELINDLLAYSRVGTRGEPFEPTSCAEVLETTLLNLRPALTESGAKVTSNSLPTVTADKTQLVQLFQNLIGNAIKFGNERPIEIDVGAKRENGEWVLSVRDNGIGIDPQYAERIFMIFQRLHGAGDYPGTGLGLAVCKKIVERHGGRIWVESEPDKGSTFYFTLPAEGGSHE